MEIGKGHVKVETEIRAIQPQAKDSQGCLAATKLGEMQGTDSSSEPNLPIFDFWTSNLQECERILRSKFCGNL